MERIPIRKLANSLYIYSSQQASSSCLSNRNHAHLVRHFSTTPSLDNKQKGFFSRFIENFKSDLFKDKEVQDSLKEFRQRREILEDADAVKQAREKFRQVEEESKREAIEAIENAKQSIKSGVKKAAEADIVKKTMKFGEKISTKAKGAAEEISKQSQILKDTSAYKKVSSATKSVEKELDQEILSKLYTTPETLLKRSDRSTLEKKEVAPNEDVSSVDLHKDTKWSQNWKKFKDDNPYMNKVFEFKMKFDESDNPFIRVTRNFVDKISEITGGLFQQTDLSNVLTEICKIDPNFDINEFLKECENVIVPTILEAMIQNRPEILSDWCHEAVFNVLIQPQKEAQKLNMKLNSKILDLQNFELAMGKMMEQGPVLVITFQAQQTTYLTDIKGNVVEGDPDKIIQNSFVMAFCRDQNDLDPSTAWRLIDVAMQPTQFSF